MTEEDVRKYEQRLQAETNRKVHQGLVRTPSRDSASDAGDDDEFADAVEDQSELAQGGSWWMLDVKFHQTNAMVWRSWTFMMQ